MSAASSGDAVGEAVGTAGAEPLFRVVRGTPTDVELAALSVVLAARTRPVEGSVAPPPGPTAWAASGRLRRGGVRPGPDVWRRSARP